MNKNYFFDEEVSVDERMARVSRIQTSLGMNFSEVYHKDFDSFMDIFIIFGNKNSIYLSGPHGSGKSSIIRQACEIVGLNVSEHSYTNDDSIYEVIGDLISSGQKGEVFVINDADKIDKNIIKEILSTSEKMKKQNPDFHLILVGNDYDVIESSNSLSCISIDTDPKIEREKISGNGNRKRLRDVALSRKS